MPDQLARTAANAEALLWQGRVRFGVALALSVGEFLLLQATGANQPIGPLLITMVAYVAVIGVLCAVVWGMRQAPDSVVTATVLADLAFAFALTLNVSAPAYYGRILVFAFVSLYLTEFYFGRTQATIALIAVVLGYLVTVSLAISRGSALQWPEELWSLGVFLAAVGGFALLYGNIRTRLENIARLMERGAEEGDFPIPYDTEADLRPDAITMVGRAYNLARDQMTSMVTTDPLTGCLNRRGFDRELLREMARATRSHGEFSLLALDVDYFKTVNDTRGHLIGDAVLKELGSLLLQSGRAVDISARTGGEEFTIILPDTGNTGAHQVALRLCETIRSHPFIDGQKPVGLTVSIGVVSREPADPVGSGVEELKRRADDALYFAKHSGRDCARIWKSSLVKRRTASIGMAINSGEIEKPPRQA